jgi:hypothetical protein
LCKVGVHIGRFEACSTFTGYYGLSARCIAKCDTFVSKAPTSSFPPCVASIATGWSDPDAGWDLHPLKIEHLDMAHTKADPGEGGKPKTKNKG